MEKKNVERNIKLYTWYKITIDPLFWGPVIVSYILNVGKMSLTELYIMEAVVVFGLVFVEIYSSAWADLLGRKKAMILGSFLSFLAIVIFSFVDSPMQVWVSNVLIMIGFAIISGSDEAFLVDTLKEAGRYNEFTKINGSILAKVSITRAFTCIAAGYLYAISPRLPMFLSIPGVLISLILAMSLREPKSNKVVNHREHFNLMKMSVLFVANHKIVKWIIGYMIVIAIANRLWFFTYNPYFELVELRLEYFGWVFFALNLVAWLTSKYAYKIEQSFSEYKIVIALLAYTVASIVLMGLFVSKLSIVFIVLAGLSRGFRGPFFSNLINKRLDSQNRATVLSIQSSANAFLVAANLLVFGLLLGEYKLETCLLVLGATIFILGIFSIWRYKIIFQK